MSLRVAAFACARAQACVQSLTLCNRFVYVDPDLQRMLQQGNRPPQSKRKVLLFLVLG